MLMDDTGQPPQDPTPPGLTEAEKARIRETLSTLQEIRPGFTRRRSQNRMIAEVARTVAREPGQPKILLVEAPTGTGKSIGYALGGILPARERGMPVVIATATVALQEQLLTHDLPALQRAGLAFTAVLAKGRSRYVCDLRLDHLDGTDPAQGALDIGEDAAAAWTTQPSGDDLSTVSAMRREREEGDWDGDLDGWPNGVSPVVRSHVTASRHQCLGRSCEHYSACPFMVARRDLEEADVIIANQDLVLADLAGGTSILPPVNEAIWIIDEAHHLPAKATSHFTAELDLDAMAVLLQKAQGPLLTLLRRDVSFDAESIAREFDSARRALRQARAELDRLRPPDDGQREQTLIVAGDLLPAARELLGAATGPLDLVAGAAAAALKELKRAHKDGEIKDAMATGLRFRLAAVPERINEALSLIETFGAADGRVPTARWLAWQGPRMVIHAAPISAALPLGQLLFEPAPAVVLTSATLATLGTFDRFIDAAGVGDDVQTLQLPSAFDLPRQAVLEVIGGSAAADRAEAHTAELAATVIDRHAPNSGTLVLFTSHKQMREVFGRLPGTLAKHVQCQGDGSRDQLLTEHARRIDAGERSILFGVQQFSEGVDLPGKLVEVVIIAKLPFAVPDHPIERTREQWMKGQGRNYFAEVVVPDAFLRLVQMTGRLIRTETDTGTILVVDGRLATTHYGRRMLQALPPFGRSPGMPAARRAAASG